MEEDNIKISQITETSALIEFGVKIDKETNRKIRLFCQYLDKSSFKGFIEYVPYFTSVSVVYNPLSIGSSEPFETVKSILEDIISRIDFKVQYEEHIVAIPVCYEKEFAPDLEYVAKANNLTIEEVVEIHSKGEYLVYMIGFAPGFPYLGGLSEKIHTERRSTPRTVIPAGSVGIAGSQTGVYPIETPGGWQIIGRTPIKLFDLNREEKTLLKCGDIAKFYPISYDEYKQLKGNE
ncbi:5-oxoprolinase subunit PxpB [Clostridium manihotivorum]|uniref:Kinase inhibitor n=1 Tax=Clostridium manihotivorum TaxID=2320868 RepID=A0A3R5V889_9CLOT|nr:5-oxoprolinase subunit PxpB [Clostridium manihotivorum]QAA32425.1 kinase inhibitor [Clostridium manihotivorum]